MSLHLYRTNAAQLKPSQFLVQTVRRGVRNAPASNGRLNPRVLPLAFAPALTALQFTGATDRTMRLENENSKMVFRIQEPARKRAYALSLGLTIDIGTFPSLRKRPKYVDPKDPRAYRALYERRCERCPLLHFSNIPI